MHWSPSGRTRAYCLHTAAIFTDLLNETACAKLTSSNCSLKYHLTMDFNFWFIEIVRTQDKTSSKAIGGVKLDWEYPFFSWLIKRLGCWRTEDWISRMIYVFGREKMGLLKKVSPRRKLGTLLELSHRVSLGSNEYGFLVLLQSFLSSYGLQYIIDYQQETGF